MASCADEDRVLWSRWFSIFDDDEDVLSTSSQRITVLPAPANPIATVTIMASAHYGTVENNVSPIVEVPEGSNEVQPLLPPSKPEDWKPPRGFIWIEVGAWILYNPKLNAWP